MGCAATLTTPLYLHLTSDDMTGVVREGGILVCLSGRALSLGVNECKCSKRPCLITHLVMSILSGSAIGLIRDAVL